MRFMTFSNVRNSYKNKSLTARHIEIPVSIKPHALVVNSLLTSKNMDTLVFTPNYFHCYEGNVGNMAVTRKRPHRRRANICPLVTYIM